jgi:hypothetical protein
MLVLLMHNSSNHKLFQYLNLLKTRLNYMYNLKSSIISNKKYIIICDVCEAFKA